LPSAHLLKSLLASPVGEGKTILHLQDYNRLVLSLVSLPNLILATLPYLPSNALVPRQREIETEIAAAEAAKPEGTTTDTPDEPEVETPLDAPGTLDLTPRLLEAFKGLLEERGVELRFTYGDWSGFAGELGGQEGYDLVLTAETIYAESSVGALLEVLKGCYKARKETRRPPDGEGLEDKLSGMRVADDWKTPLRESEESVVLVAAKVSFLSLLWTSGSVWTYVCDICRGRAKVLGWGDLGQSESC
jgi:protein-histidine N-methyltransferase